MHHTSRARRWFQGGLLSIPFTWDFSMHHREAGRIRAQTRPTFNSLYLGFFHAPENWMAGITVYNPLSIPFTWDFSMHLLILWSVLYTWQILSIPFTWDFSMHLSAQLRNKVSDDLIFQFPLLGIFPCTHTSLIGKGSTLFLSIPFTWDFSMHRSSALSACYTSFLLSIPFTWDFSMHPTSIL